MSKRILWLGLSCLMVLSLVLVSCGTAAPVTPAPTQVTGTLAPTTTTVGKTTAPTTTATTPVKTTATTPTVEMATDSLGRTVEKPRYGGTFVTTWSASPQNFDDALLHIQYDFSLQLTNEEILTGNYKFGNSGTKEWDYTFNIETAFFVKTGQIAESWELSKDNLSVIFKIRKGIKWQNKPPYGTWSGRELTVDDIVFSLNRGFTLPTSYVGISYPYKDYIESITAPDKNTVVIKSKGVDKTPTLLLMGGDHLKMFPKDAIEKFGNLGDWRNSIGTGPYMLTDYVEGSSATFVKNPDYWGTDPFFAQNKLPYLDGVQYLIIPDTSTRYSALRTGKIDRLGGLFGPIGFEDATSIMKTNPELKYAQYFSNQSPGIFYRVDKPELPTSKVKVRQALTMAIDMKGILNGLYQGKGVLQSWPIAPHVGYKEYKPLDQLSPLIQQIFGYKVDEAKKLMADAGYATGFNAEVLCVARDVDMMSLVKNYWAAINVKLNINVVEPAVWTSTVNAKTHKDMVYTMSGPIENQIREIAWGNQANYGQVNDPTVNALRAKVVAQWDIMDKMKVVAAEGLKYVLENQYIATLPVPYSYTFWQPWIKGYSGEDSVGITNHGNYIFYIWMDTALQKATLGK